MPYAELTDSRCWYETAGQGEPLVLIPGLGSTFDVFDPIVGDLSAHFTVIRIDNRGIGRSVARRLPVSLHDYAADMVELFDHLQLDRAHVMGLSLGGMIAQRLAMNHGPRVDRLVLVSTAHRFGPYLRETAMMIGRALRHFPRSQYIRFVELLGAGPMYLDADPAAMERRVAGVAARNIPRHAIVHQLRALAASDPRPGEFVIDSPTLVIGGEYDGLIPHCFGQQMAAEIGDHAYFHLVEGAGHNPFVECPEKVMPAIVSFLTDGRAGASDTAGGTGEAGGDGRDAA